MENFKRYLRIAIGVSGALLSLMLIAHYFWPDNWWPKGKDYAEIPTVAAKSKELTWNGYDPLVVVADVVPGEWISIRLEPKNRPNKISLSYGATSAGKTLATRIFGPEGFVIKRNAKDYKFRPFQYDDSGRKIPPLAVVAVLTADPEKWWSAPLSVVSWSRAEEFDKKTICKNEFKQTLACILVLNQPLGYRQTKGLIDPKFSMTFLVTENVPIAAP